MNIGVKMYSVIRSLYENIKSCVTLNDQMPEFFNCQIGLREGENLSPILFSFYLNDLRNHLSPTNTGIEIDYEDQLIQNIKQTFDCSSYIHYIHIYTIC